MSHSNIQNCFVSVSIVFIVLTLITVFYISSRSDLRYSFLQLTNSIISRRNDNYVRVCCLVLTKPGNFLTQARAVNRTWGPRCDGFFFITESSKQQMTPEQAKLAEDLPIAPIPNITAGYDHLTQKSTLAFLFAYEHHANNYDWFVKADDDTYLIVEHLKMFLREQNTSEPVTFGYNFKVSLFTFRESLKVVKKPSLFT